MPSPSYENAEILAEKFLKCNAALDELFAGAEVTRKLQKQIEQIKAYYKRAFKQTADEEKGELVIEQYRMFITTALQVQLGQLESEKAYEIIAKELHNKETSIIIHNILKLFEVPCFG